MSGQAGAAGGGAGAGGNSGGAGAAAAGGAGPAAGAGGGAGSGAGGAGAPAGGAGAGAAGGAGSGAAAGGAPDWTSGLNDDFKGFVQNKGWKDPTQVVDSYRNLEKLLGAPQNEVIRLPKEDDTAGWESVHTRLGRPANAEGYKIEAPKEGGDPAFAKWASEQFFKAGLSEKQGKAIMEGWNAQQKTLVDGAKEAYTAKVNQETTALKKEWGAAYDQNMAAAKRAAREFGVADAVIDGMEASAGLSATYKFFAAVGSKMGEAAFVGGNPGGGDGSGAMTPAQAVNAIKTLKGDPGFVKKYVEGDAAARAKMEALHRFANPES